jgi:hypothetical protein
MIAKMTTKGPLRVPNDSRGGADKATELAKEALRLPFPSKLFEMLEDADEKGFRHVVSWTSEGDGFMVHDTAAFMKQVTPQYFKQTKYKSFQRQLSLYGFTRIATGKRKGLRLHKDFLRGQLGLCRLMKPVSKESQLPSPPQSSGKPISEEIKLPSPPRSSRNHTFSPTPSFLPKVVSQGDIRRHEEPSTLSLDENKVDKVAAMSLSETHSVSPESSPISVENLRFFEGKRFFLMGAPHFKVDGVHYQEEPVAPILPQQPLFQAQTFPSLALSETVMSDDVLKAQMRKAWKEGFAKALTISSTKPASFLSL